MTPDERRRLEAIERDLVATLAGPAAHDLLRLRDYLRSQALPQLRQLLSPPAPLPDGSPTIGPPS